MTFYNTITTVNHLIERDLYKYLVGWRTLASRLPLILRGARQVGKTTLINEFGKSFDHYLYFNLEKKTDFDLFGDLDDLANTIQLLYLARRSSVKEGESILIFIDEVQERPEVLTSLRYFYEDHNHIHVITSGSLLEFALAKIEKVPVGRVEYAELHPLSFREYLYGVGGKMMLKAYDQMPVNNTMLPLLMDAFHEYAMIGGMPQIVSAYIEADLKVEPLFRLYASILESYKTDVEKYSKNDSDKAVIRHIIETAPSEVDNRINLNNFGNSSFSTYKVKNAMYALTKARLLELIYPTTEVKPPAIPNLKKRPRLHYLDIGLLNYQLDMHQELLTIKDLNDSTRGKLLQQVVSQEIKSKNVLPSKTLPFWVRDERGTSSEVDIVFPYRHMLIPIEIKSGATGRLRSLHEYMDRCDHDIAIRMYAGKLAIDTLKTRKGKEYRLLNLPYVLCGKLSEYVEWMFTNDNIHL